MTEARPGDYVIVAGFILCQLHEVHKPGDYVAWAGWRVESSTWMAGASI
jgi:hypothetical protein